MSLRSDQYALVRKLALSEAGIVLGEDKNYLIDTRIAALALARREQPSHLIDQLNGRPDPELLCEVIEALTTNETSFFRDRHPFDVLKDHLLPELLDSRRRVRRLRIWSAASSTGQEPYSLAILLRENFPQLASWQVEILGTDLNTQVLERARQGRYTRLEVNRGLPAPMLLRHFKQEGRWWVVKPELRRWMRFEQLNLLGRWPPYGAFDLILVRNVLIYFERPAAKKILTRARSRLATDGSLLLGSSETGIGIADAFHVHRIGRLSVFRTQAPKESAA